MPLYLGSKMVSVLSGAAGGSSAKLPVLEELTATENKEYTPGEGVDGFSKVVVNVESPVDLESLIAVCDAINGEAVDGEPVEAKVMRLMQTKEDIKAALIEQGQTVTDADAFSSYADKVRAIEGSGTIEGLCNIYYMSDDGKTRLFKKPVMWGDTAGDVIALKMMDTPTKEEENVENTFLGWTDEVGGTVKTSMFKTVTEDRIVYAVFKSVAIIDSGECGEAVTWKLNAENKLTISGEGAITDFANSTSVPWYSYKSTITELAIEDGISHIGNWSFYECRNVTSVTIPDSVTSIGSDAFKSCSRLTSVTIPDSVTTLGTGAFNFNSALTSVIIGNGITHIPNYCFNQASNLTNVSLGNSITHIGASAFGQCYKLNSITLPSSVVSIGEKAFYLSVITSLVIPSNVTYIGKRAFYQTSTASQTPVLIMATFKKTSGWWYADTSEAANGTDISDVDLDNAYTAASYLTNTLVEYYWHRTE